MRLTDFEIESIKQQAVNHFGEDVHVYLFGSRTDDRKKGGDIDLFIQNQDDKKSDIKSKIDFITDLILLLGDQKIDVILDNTNIKKTGFYKSILKTAILL